MTNNHPLQVPRVIGHRGAAGHAPENTIAAIEKAAQLGARWVEFDVKLTRDGALILFHDDTLERTTDGKGLVADMTLADIRGLDAGKWYQARFAGERVPTLMDALATLARLGLGANVEIKPSSGREQETGAATAAVLKAHWPGRLPAPVLSSFRAEALAAAQAAAPEFPRAFLIGAVPDDWRAKAETLGATAIHCNHQFIDRPRILALQGAGYAVRCYTVNDPRVAAQLFSWGVDSVFTDYPDRILGV